MKPKIILILAGLIIIAGLVAFGWYFIPKLHLPKTIIKSATTTPGYYQINYVVDGDTIAVNMDGKEEKVRLIGLDTPETKKPNSPVECFGKAASDYAHKLMDNQSVRLETDPINTNRDRYDRLLRYVYLKDGRMINREMITQGYGFAYLSFPFTKSDEFRQYQKEASEAERGLWASGVCEIHDVNGRNKTNTL
ncbi:MAG: thermonuclease family protein [Candidatus Saccharibacteria bacterium]